MLDAIKLRLDRLFLNLAACAPGDPPEYFKRSHYTERKAGRPATMTLSLCLPTSRYALVKIICKKLDDGRWHAWKVETTLPALVYGHNGRTLTSQEDLALALTRLAHIIRPLIEPDGHGRIIPGVGAENLGFIDYIECSVQVQDPDQRLLFASHLARLKHQHRPSMIFWGETSLFGTRELSIIFYDKKAKIRNGFVEPADTEATRVEVILKDELRLGKELRAINSAMGRKDALAVTLALDDAYHLHRRSLGRLTGFGWIPEVGSLEGLNKNARMMAGTLGQAIHDRHRLDQALEAYRINERPNSRTFRETERDLRAFAVCATIPNPLGLLPLNPRELAKAEVHWPEREQEFEILMRDIGAPSEPDPAIAAVWSQSRMQPPLPHDGALVGTVMPAPAPFRFNSL